MNSKLHKKNASAVSSVTVLVCIVPLRHRTGETRWLKFCSSSYVVRYFE